MESVLVIICGLLVGSFLNVCILRIPKKESLWWPRSHCVSCHKTIAPYDLIPVFSFILLKGTCRYCKAPISLQYPLVELLITIIILFLYLKYGFSAFFFMGSFLSSVLTIVTFIDLKHYIIPDMITLPGIFLGLGFSFLHTSLPAPIPPLDSVLGLVVGGGSLLLMGQLYYLWRKKEGMGGGDIKLAGFLGAWLGYKAIIFILFSGSFLGAFIGSFYLFLSKKSRSEPLPFGPFLAGATLIYLFFGSEIMNWYF